MIDNTPGLFEYRNNLGCFAHLTEDGWMWAICAWQDPDPDPDSQYPNDGWWWVEVSRGTRFHSEADARHEAQAAADAYIWPSSPVTSAP